MDWRAATWRGGLLETGRRRRPWDSITFDPELNRIYLGTANAGPE